MRKFKIIYIALTSIMVLFPVYSQETVEIIKDKYKDLQLKYETVIKDRDNVVTQMRYLIKYKNETRKLETKTTKLENFNAKLKSNNENLKEKIEELGIVIKEFHSLDLEKTEQVESLKKHIENMEIEYRIVNETSKKLKFANRKIDKLKKEIHDLNKKIQKIEAHKFEAKAASQAYRRQIKDLRVQYREALSFNKQLESKLDQIPQKFAEVARENRMLVKETALMHYNLGVFYLEEGEYRRSLAEFEKTLELNPDDAYAHFNLGYVYSEYVVSRPRAVKHFKEYLRLTKSDDKDVDWVKKYIITWQAWEGKQPLK